jgi:DnaJ-class molecular chaperone
MRVNYANPDYPRMTYHYRQHHERFERRVLSLPRKLVCQECKGMGGHKEIIDPELGGPWESCGWCEGTGYVTPHLRGFWLRSRRHRVAQGIAR